MWLTTSESRGSQPHNFPSFSLSQTTDDISVALRVWGVNAFVLEGLMFDIYLAIVATVKLIGGSKFRLQFLTRILL